MRKMDKIQSKQCWKRSRQKAKKEIRAVVKEEKTKNEK